MNDPLILSLRIALALFLGAMLGLERTFAGKNAGLRTFGLVSMGAAIFAATSLLLTEDISAEGGGDLLRTVAGVTTGSGFIGAGLIFTHRGSVHGLTTAAGLWVASAIGMAAGFGHYTLSLVALFLTLLTLKILLILENSVRHSELMEEQENHHENETKE